MACTTMAGVAVPALCAQVGVGAWGLRVVITMTATTTATTAFRAWTAIAACRCLWGAAASATAGALATAWAASTAAATITATTAAAGLARAAFTLSLATLARLIGADAVHHFAAGSLGRGLHHVTARGLACAAPDGLASHGDGFGLFASVGAEAFNDLHGNLLLGKAFDVHHEAFFVHADQADSLARGTGTACAADAVYVVF